MRLQPVTWRWSRESSRKKRVLQRTVRTYLDVFPSLTDELLQVIRPFVAFVQLFVSHELKPDRLFVFNTRWLPNPTGTVGLLSSHVDPYPEPPGSMWWWSEKKHAVDGAEETRLKEVWPKYRGAMSDRRFARACSRYSLSLHRESDEDRIIDHWVGLESLFGKGSEIATTVALKLAILLEKKVPIRKAYRRWIAAHYGVRSALVHGGDLDGALKRFVNSVNKDMQQTIPAIPKAACIFSADWLERSLIRLAEDFHSLEELDEALLYGLLKRDQPKLPSLPKPPKPPELLLGLLAAIAAKGKEQKATAATVDNTPAEETVENPDLSESP